MQFSKRFFVCIMLQWCTPGCV